MLYGLGARWRARHWRGRRRRLPRPVVSVGNLTFGGTGKTPFVIHVCEALLRRGRRPVVLSRGYRATGPEGNDEAKVIRAHLPRVPHVQSPDRHRAGMGIVEHADVFVLDDGFQHHPLHRDVDIVLIDATDPFGGGACPPGGRLREPRAALDRADLVVITRSDLVPHASLGETMREVRALTAAPVATGRFVPSCAGALSGREVLVACGIGNPRAFVATVRSMGATVARTRVFPDHHDFGVADVAELSGAGLPVVVTEKDAVKLSPLWGGPAPLLTVMISFEATGGGEEIEAILDRV